MNYIKRSMEEEILRASKEYPVILVTGPRQVGKSTMLNHIKEENRHYVTLDNLNARMLALNDPDLFFDTYPYPLIIDEFHRVPSLLLKIKEIVDRLALEGKDNNGLFWLAGTQKFKMMKNIPESLAGRVAIFELSSLSFQERRGLSNGPFKPEIEELKKRTLIPLGVKEIYEDIFIGGMPRLVTQHLKRESYYENYINTYLERDVRELEGVGKLNEFYNFLVYMASRTAQELHYDNIAKSIGVSAVTAKTWVNILERSGIIFILRPYYRDVTSRLVKTPKVYFMDTGLAAYLARWPSAATLANGHMDGAIFETYVVSEIVKGYLNSGLSLNNLFYYRDIDKKEIDLLMVDVDSIYPIEIKKNKTPSHASKNFSCLEKFNLKIKPGLVICLAEELLPYSKDVYYCPVSLI